MRFITISMMSGMRLGAHKSIIGTSVESGFGIRVPYLHRPISDLEVPKYIHTCFMKVILSKSGKYMIIKFLFSKMRYKIKAFLTIFKTSISKTISGMQQKKKVIVLIILKKTINVKLRVSPTCLILGYEQNQYNECDRFLVFTIPIFQDSFSKFHFFFSKEKYNIFF